MYCQMSFQKDYTNLHSHQQCRRVPAFPKPHEQNVLPCFLSFACLIDEKWYLSAVLICISLIMSVFEDLLYSRDIYT